MKKSAGTTFFAQKVDETTNIYRDSAYIADTNLEAICNSNSNSNSNISNYNINISIDSIHIISRLSPYDMIIFNYRFRIIEKESTNEYTKQYDIFIDQDNCIKVTYIKYHNLYKYEFGGLSQYKDLNQTFIFILRKVYKSLVGVNRLDIAIDIKNDFSKFNIEPIIDSPKNNYRVTKLKNTTYHKFYYSKNKLKHQLVVYEKSLHNELAYDSISRFELRIHKDFFSSRKLKDLLTNKDSIQKLEKSIREEILPMYNIKYDGHVLNFDFCKFEEMISLFIEFLNSDTLDIKTPYNKLPQIIKSHSDAIKKIKRTYDKKSIYDIVELVASKNLTINGINQKTKIDRKIVTKIIKYFS